MKKLLLSLLITSFVYGNEMEFEEELFDFSMSPFVTENLEFEVTDLDFQEEEKIVRVYPFSLDMGLTMGQDKFQFALFAHIVHLEKGKILLTVSQKPKELLPETRAIFKEFDEAQEDVLLLPFNQNIYKALPAFHFADLQESGPISRKVVAVDEKKYTFDDGFTLDNIILASSGIISDGEASLKYEVTSENPLKIDISMSVEGVTITGYAIDQGDLRVYFSIVGVEGFNDEITFDLRLSKKLRDAIIIDDLVIGDEVIFYPFTLVGEEVSGELYFVEVKKLL